MNTVLVTGATGFLGRLLLRKLINSGYHVLSLQRKIDSELSSIFNNNQLIQFTCDLSNPESNKLILPCLEVQYFFHLAWQGVSGKEREDLYIQEKNTTILKNSIKIAKKYSVKKFISIGTIMELEIALGLFENKKIFKSAYYGLYKSLCHAILLNELVDTNIQPIWIYLTNIYGETDTSNRFINSTLKKIINKESLNFTAASQNYDFLYGDDAANAIQLIAEKGKLNSYLLGSGTSKELYRYINDIVEVTQYKEKPIFGSVPFEGVNLPMNFFSIEILQKETKFMPTITFLKGIEKVYLTRKKEMNK
jgi:UDP-glucose 4-epimerase